MNSVSRWVQTLKHWIGIDALTAPDGLLRELTRNSYNIVRTKYKASCS